MLGDVLPLPLAHEVVSFGDLIVVFGVADAVRELSRRRARREPRGRRDGLRRLGAPRRRRAPTRSGAPRRAARPVSAAQYSANPDVTAPVTIDLDRDAAAVRVVHRSGGQPEQVGELRPGRAAPVGGRRVGRFGEMDAAGSAGARRRRVGIA